MLRSSPHSLVRARPRAAAFTPCARRRPARDRDRDRSARARSRFALALALVVARASSIAEAIEAKCSACRAVGKSLAKALREDAESADGKVVDMRGRLDSRGRRYGKRISYKVSELRFVELLDGVCDERLERGGKVSAPRGDESGGESRRIR